MQTVSTPPPVAANVTDPGVGTKRGDGPCPPEAHTGNGGDKDYNIPSHPAATEGDGGR